jgi:hypothetical protein
VASPGCGHSLSYCAGCPVIRDHGHGAGGRAGKGILALIGDDQPDRGGEGITCLPVPGAPGMAECGRGAHVLGRQLLQVSDLVAQVMLVVAGQAAAAFRIVS